MKKDFPKQLHSLYISNFHILHLDGTKSFGGTLRFFPIKKIAYCNYTTRNNVLEKFHWVDTVYQFINMEERDWILPRLISNLKFSTIMIRKMENILIKWTNEGYSNICGKNIFQAARANISGEILAEIESWRCISYAVV